MDGQVKIGVRNFIVVGSLALLFIFVGKVLTAKYPIAGLSPLFAAA